MRLPIKIIASLSGALLCFAVASYAILHHTIYPAFIELEQKEAQLNLERAFSAIERELRHMEILTEDWAAWTDTYDFVQSRDMDYIEDNLIPETFEATRTKAIYLYDANGDVVWGRALDLDTGEDIRLAGFPQDGLPADSPLLLDYDAHTDFRGLRASGIVMSGDTPLLVTSSPIVTSEYDGPPRGFMVTGRLLDDLAIERLSKQTQVNLEVLPTHAGNTSAELERVRATLDAGERFAIDKVDNKTLHIYAEQRDINGDSAFIIKTVFPRDISLQGIKAIRTAVLSSILAGTVLLVLLALILQQMIARPVAKLTHHARSIERSGDFSRRIGVTTNDEIGELADAFDNMIVRVEDQTNKTRAAHDALEAELEQAAEYVQSLIPAPRPANPRIDWVFRPSQHLGGDGFGYHWLDDDHLAIYLIDVCGHGVGPALLSVSAIDALRGQGGDMDRRSPAAVLAAMNRRFPMEAHNDLFFALWYGVYHKRTRRLRCASGGNPPAILVRDDGTGATYQELGSPGLMIGSMPDLSYDEAECDIAGGTLFVFSDGLFDIEIAAESGRRWSYTEWRDLLLASPHASCEAIVAELARLQGGDAFEDDLSLLKIVAD